MYKYFIKIFYVLEIILSLDYKCQNELAFEKQ